MEENFEYLKSKTLEELLKIIDDFNDMDETVEVLIVLREINKEKALEKGINFLRNNEGDEYFQAMIIDIIDGIDFCKILDCISQRKDPIQAYLLGHVMNEMVSYTKDKCVHNYEDFVLQQYGLLNENEKTRIVKSYNDFVETFNIKNE